MSFNFLYKAEDFMSNYDGVVSNKTAKSKALNEQSQYEKVRESIKQIAALTFPGSSVAAHFYGSRIIGVGSDLSDLDIFVDIGGRFTQNYTKTKQNDDRFWKNARAVQLSTDWRVTKKVLKTVVPVVKAVYLPLQLDCDIILTNGISTCHTRVLAHLFSIQPEAVKFFHFIKSWLNHHGCHFSGFTITLLVVFYLQAMNLFPSIKTVQQGVPVAKVAVWEVQFNTSRNLTNYGVMRMENYKKFAPGFFKFFSNFNYDRVMSTLTGASIDSISHKAQYPRFLLKGLYIAGPFNQERNCGIVNDEDKEHFIQLCKDSKDFFDKINI